MYSHFSEKKKKKGLYPPIQETSSTAYFHPPFKSKISSKEEPHNKNKIPSLYNLKCMVDGNHPFSKLLKVTPLLAVSTHNLKIRMALARHQLDARST